jgi:hypothetical protein
MRIRRRLDGLVMRGSQSRVARILLFVNRYLIGYSNEAFESTVRTDRNKETFRLSPVSRLSPASDTADFVRHVTGYQDAPSGRSQTD